MISTTYSLIILISLWKLGIFATEFQEVEVTIKHGTIQGYKQKVNGNYVNAFLSIPFAEAPIGNLRFRKPHPITKKWSTTLKANKLPKHCIQDLKFLEEGQEVSEDCLYINVWTPVNLENDVKPHNLKAVMFYVHGGMFTIWGSANRHFNGSVLASFGDVVVVTFNYRLGAFGFLSTGNNDAPGNAGLYDQALALEWVQENIAYFGGDPQKVTIFGESVGAISISLHLLSPIIHNTIKRAILMSGASFRNVAVDSKEAALQKSVKLAELLECFNEDGVRAAEYIDMDCLRSVDAQKIVSLQTSSEVSVLSTSLTRIWFAPIFGEAFIPMKPKKMLQEGYMNSGIDLLVGTMSDEGYVIQLLFNFLNCSPNTNDWQQRFEYFMTHFFNDFSSEENQKLTAFYFSDIGNKSSDEAKMAYFTALGDVYFNCETFYFSQHVSKFSNLYHFLFEYVILNSEDHPMSLEINKACHTYELPLTFGTVSSENDVEVSKKWMRILVNFAKSGTVEWPMYTSESNPYLVFTGDESSDRILYNFRNEACELWNPILEKNY